MIVTRLQGGLGNQMFQYAAGRALALRRGVELRLDLSRVEDSEERSYALGPFPIQAGRASEADVRRLTAYTRPVRALRKLLGLAASRPASYVKEGGQAFEPALLDLPDGSYLDGYWQSELYFRDCEARLREELQPPAPESSDDQAVARQIDEGEAVSVHIRRGDYVTSPSAAEILGTCGLDYYQRAFDWLRERVAVRRVFVFSDDPEWASANVDLPVETTWVTHNRPEEAHLDLALMARCNHHIIANSSFSWWGAWLSAHPDQLVVAPRKWFQPEEMSSADLVPERWTRL